MVDFLGVGGEVDENGGVCRLTEEWVKKDYGITEVDPFQWAVLLGLLVSGLGVLGNGWFFD